MKTDLFIVSRETRHFTEYFEIENCNEVVTFDKAEALSKFSILKKIYASDESWDNDGHCSINMDDEGNGTIICLEKHEVDVPENITVILGGN